MATRSPIFSRSQPGGVFTIVNYGEVNGSVWFVDSNSTTGADSAGYGQNPDAPCLTLDYAVGLCATGDTIYVAEGHNEGAAAATLADLDVAGIKVIGCGVGSRRPTFDFDNAATAFKVGANDITIKNVIFRPSVTAVLKGIEIETDVTGTVIEDVELAIGEDGAGTDEFVKGVYLTSGNHDTVLRRVKILSHASAAQSTHAIHVAAASDRLTLDGVVIDGPWATNGILEGAAGVNHVVRNCAVDVTGTGYGFHASSTFASFRANTGAEERPVNRLGQEFYEGLGYKVTKVEAVDAVASDDLFTLTGKVAIRLWAAEVTNALGAAVNDYQITLTTLNGVLLAAGDIKSSIVGHMFTLNGDAGSTALNTSTGAVSVSGVGDANTSFGPIVVGKAGGSDVIKSVRTAGDAGDAIRHDVFYLPLETSASLVTAA